MKVTTLFYATLIISASLATIGCFDSESDVAAATLNANAAMDSAAIDGSASSIDGSVVSEEGGISAANEDTVSKNPNIPEYKTSSAESKSAYAEFLKNPITTKAPAGIPEKGGVSHKPMNSGSVVLKRPDIAPVDSPYYGEENTVKCATSPLSFYCSDQYLLQVQQSKNRIVFKDGTEVVLTPAFANSKTHILTYIGKNKQAQPSGNIIGAFGQTKELPVKYARINGEACVYGELYSSGVINSLIYNCYKPGEDVTDLGLLLPLVLGQQTFDSTFTSSDIELLPQSNYDSFVSLMP